MRPVLAFLFFTLAALPPAAFSCPSCDHPPEAPGRNQDSSAPFDARADLSAEEEAHLLALEGGRYRRRGPYLEEARAADPSRHLLTVAQASELLKARSEIRVKRLEDRADAGALDEADRAEAVALRYTRGALLEEGQRRFLDSLLAHGAKETPASKWLEEKPQVLAAPGAFRAPPGLGALPPPGVLGAPDPLLVGLKERLLFDDHGSVVEKTAFDTALARMLTSPTARELASELIAQGLKAMVSFEDFPNTDIVSVNGKKYLYGTGGSTSYESRLPVIKLNKGYLQVDPYYREVRLPTTIAHELLGHAMEDHKAIKAGFQRLYNDYDGNETNAQLVTHLVSADLSSDTNQWLSASHMWSYLESPPRFHEKMQLIGKYYAITFRPEELADPVATLERRLLRVQEERERLKAKHADRTFWKSAVAHLVSEHAYPAKTFEFVSGEIERDLTAYIPHDLKRLDEIEAKLNEYIKYYRTGTGRREIAGWQKPKAQEFLREREAALDARQRKLEAVLKEKKIAAPVSSGPSGGWLWEALRKEYEKDKLKHPDHWKTI